MNFAIVVAFAAFPKRHENVNLQHGGRSATLRNALQRSATLSNAPRFHRKQKLRWMFPGPFLQLLAIILEADHCACDDRASSATLRNAPQRSATLRVFTENKN
jgi:hypothetical protein